jgi:GTPase SAR1 family protein
MYGSQEETKKDDLQYEHKIRGIKLLISQFFIKVILIGEPFVGKTSLLSK